MDDLIREGFQPYLTSVGGSGLGILSPYAEHRNRRSRVHYEQEGYGQVTPPDTPLPRDGEGEAKIEALKAPFASTTSQDLTTWASELGRWLYV